MATSGSGTLYPNNASYTIPVEYSWTRDANGVVSWKAQIYAIGGGTGVYDSSPCWTTFYIRGGKNAQNDLTGNLAEYCSTCAECAQYYQGNILWQHNDVRNGSLTGTINMGTGGGTLKLGYYGQRNGSNTSEDYLTWTVDPVVTAPTGLDVTSITVGAQSIKATVSVTGWGGAGDANSRYRELQVWASNMSGDNKVQTAYGNTLSSEITCDNSSSGALSIIPNTKYWIGAYASNGTLNTGSQSFGTAITNVPTAGATLGSTTMDTATINYSIANQGGERDIKIDQNLDSGGWTNVTTLSGSGVKTGSFTITGLLPNSSHSTMVRSSAVGGSVAGGTTVSNIITKPPVPIMEAGSISKNSAIINYYVPQQGGAQTLYVEYALDGGAWTVADTLTTSGDKSGSFTLNGFAPDTPHTVQCRIRLSGGATQDGDPVSFTTHDTYAKMYCSVNDAAKTVTKVYCSVSGARKRVIKIYGSVNGQRKLVWEEP